MVKKQKNSPEKFELIPPETDYISEVRMIAIPLSDPRLNDRWRLRLHAEKLIEQQLGDEVQLTNLRVKKPHIVHKAAARLFRREPTALLYVTIKF